MESWSELQGETGFSMENVAGGNGSKRSQSDHIRPTIGTLFYSTILTCKMD
jgi:hypothetical protein